MVLSPTFFSLVKFPLVMLFASVTNWDTNLLITSASTLAFLSFTAKSTYAYIEEKVKQKLSGWNARNFSLAGRITLAKAVLSSIPLYTMQTSQLPASLCSKLEKITRDFIWNSTVDQHRTSLVSWKEMCRPQQFFGCGLKKLSSQNQALLMKIGFALISRPDQLLVQVLRAKYKWSPEGRVPPNVRNCSA